MLNRIIILVSFEVNMKKKLALFIMLSMLLPNLSVFAETSDNSTEVVAPKWEDYIPTKYQNPRKFSRGKTIGELATGIVLTELLITAPVGVPMIVHSTTKMKNINYYNKKIKFENGLAEAEKIQNPKDKELYYQNLLNDCDMTVEDKVKQEKKQSKIDKKLAKKEAKEQKKQEKLESEEI